MPPTYGTEKTPVLSSHHLARPPLAGYRHPRSLGPTPHAYEAVVSSVRLCMLLPLPRLVLPALAAVRAKLTSDH